MECRARRFTLPFDSLPTRAEWEKRAQSDDHWIAYHAKRNLARLDRGEKLVTDLPYTVQTWNFGDEMAMVFLAGEVVVDYSLRLKKELGPGASVTSSSGSSRLRLKKELAPAAVWVTGYANDVMAYIPSERVLKEGGYEGDTSMIPYGLPSKWRAGLEEKIVGKAKELAQQVR